MVIYPNSIEFLYISKAINLNPRKTTKTFLILAKSTGVPLKSTNDVIQSHLEINTKGFKVQSLKNFCIPLFILSLLIVGKV